MATSTRAFLQGLYHEYLEEASFLYEQRPTLLVNPKTTWKRISELEERFEAHIDGLVVGEALALDVCSRQVASGDVGETHAAVRVFCRQNRKDLLLRFLDELDAADTARVQSVADALKCEIPFLWQPDLGVFLQSNDPKLVLIAAEVIGYRRFGLVKELLGILENSSPGVLSKTIWALGRLGEQQARPAISSFLSDRDEAVRATAALALLRLGDQDALDYCQQRASSELWAILPTALGGHRHAFEVLSQGMAGKASTECLTGMGLLGFAAAIPLLTDSLGNKETAVTAANSLDRITGAALQEEVFVPEEVDEDELFEEERGRFKAGNGPTRADGNPFGGTVKRVSQNAEDWQQWWDEHRSSMDSDTCYRNGLPYSPKCLVLDLAQERTPHDARRLTYEELVIRYGLEIPFEADMSVAQQREALSTTSEWAQDQENRFTSGRSYFARKLIS